MNNNFAGLDFQKRQRFLKKEFKIVQYKSLTNDLSLPKVIRAKAQVKLASLSHFNKQKIRNRCILSGRGKAVYKKFGISRIIMRNLGHSGNIVGLKKASW